MQAIIINNAIRGDEMKILLYIFIISTVLTFNSNVVLASPTNKSVYAFNYIETPIDENFMLLQSSLKVIGTERYAEGIIKNVGTKNARCVRIVVSFYDKDNKLVTKAGAFTQNIDVGKQWFFSIHLCSRTPTDFKVSEIYYELY
jgi:hypothetical protein